MASLTQTDLEGRYRLENIPPGRYFIAAGPLAAATFYPGTLLRNDARVVTIEKDGPDLSGIDFAIGKVVADSPSPNPLQPCCYLSGLLLTEDGTPLPSLTFKVVETRSNVGAAVEDGFFRLFLQLGTTARLAVEGLPAGYSLNSVVYGGRNTGSAGIVLIDGRQPESLLLTISAQPGSALPSVSVRGRVTNIASELNTASLSLVLTSTLPSGATVVTPIQPDDSFEFSSIPIGAYHAAVRNAAGILSTSSLTTVIRNDVSDLKIDFGNNPFPDVQESIVTGSIFTGGEEKTITGVATGKLTPIRNSSRSVYFRMNVKDQRTGVVSPWAVYVANPSLVPNIAPGETYTLTGTTAIDGTNRLKAQPF